VSGELRVANTTSAATLAVIPGSATALRDRAAVMAAAFKDYPVTDRVTFLKAVEDLRTVKDLQKQLEGLRTSVTGPLNVALRTVNDWFRDPAGKLAEAENALKNAMGAFERQERARAEAEERAARERARAEAEELERRAAKAAEAGKAEKAAELQARAAGVVAAPTPTAPVRAAGVSFGDYWGFDIENEDDLPREYLKPDLEKIGKVVRALKDGTKIKGVKVWNRPQVGARGGR
jgi:hypothetical protein